MVALASSLAYQSCSGPFGCEPSEPYEAIVIDNFMWSFDGNGEWAQTEDTVSAFRASRRTMVFSTRTIPKYPKISLQPNAWTFFPQAYACSPIDLPYSLQQFDGARITSNVSFGDSYPAGTDLSPLFDLYGPDNPQSSLTLRRVLDSLEIAPFIGENNTLVRYYFRGTANAGEEAQFQWEIYLDGDTLRRQSNWWQF